MNILFVSAEVAPFAKVGGLADVAGSLPKALKALGNDVRVAMPGYRMALAGSKQLFVTKVEISPEWTEQGAIYETAFGDVPLYLVGGQWFDESDRSEKVYFPGEDQHIYFAHAVLDMCRALGWTPDIVHCNDWHTGLLPVLMREKDAGAWYQSGAVFTIHNLAYQGEFGPETLSKAGLPERLFNPHQLETFGRFNFLKAGCVYADQVNTVSPTYAREIQTAEFGCSLHGLMLHLSEHGRLRGILNGIDTAEFDPATDKRIAAHFSADDLSGKGLCREALLDELNLDCPEGAPLIGVVTRLSEQKGVDLVAEAAEELFSLPATLIIQGIGDQWLTEKLRALDAANPRRFRFVERFDADLAQKVYAGSDLFLMPSLFEPCGLGQMIAMRYGAIPIVRRTGGLADTVREPENGFVFTEMSGSALVSAAGRAVAAFNRPSWPAFVDRAMRSDHSWGRSAGEYEKMYGEALRSRGADRAAS